VLPPDLVTTVREYYEAQLRNDVAALDRLVSDDYVLINSDGSVEDKRQAVGDHERPGFKIDPYVTKQPIEKVWGDAALTGGVVNLRWTQDGKHQTRLIRIVNVWARRDGRWQVTYTQVSRLPQPGSEG
jgi:ketosteroid isomerase-like protein